MIDIINRQDALDALGDEPIVADENDDYDVATRNQWRYDVECIKEVPSAQKHGKWIYDKETRFDRCSACGLYGVAEMKFCPNCGARMDGER